MSEYREIMTKAVVGKGRQYTKLTHTIEPSNTPTSILGCWVINHSYEAKRIGGGKVECSGYYDINTWHSYNDNTKTAVETKREHYKVIIKVRYRDKNYTGEDYEIIARVMQHPNCLEAKISEDGNIIAAVEFDMLAEVVGETKMCVLCNPEGCQDDDEEYLDVDDEDFEDLDPHFMDEEE